MLQFFQDLARRVHKLLNSPMHIRLTAIEDNPHDCLRRLEYDAGLPYGDLSHRGDTMKVASFPTGHSGVQHVIVSKTSNKWKADVAKEGYISGSVTVYPRGGPSKETCIGRLHVSRNCPGVYSRNKCTTCGDAVS